MSTSSFTIAVGGTYGTDKPEQSFRIPLKFTNRSGAAVTVEIVKVECTAANPKPVGELRHNSSFTTVSYEVEDHLPVGFQVMAGEFWTQAYNRQRTIVRNVEQAPEDAEPEPEAPFQVELGPGESRDYGLEVEGADPTAPVEFRLTARDAASGEEAVLRGKCEPSKDATKLPPVESEAMRRVLEAALTGDLDGLSAALGAEPDLLHRRGSFTYAAFMAATAPPLWFAALGNHPEVVSYLRRLGAQVEVEANITLGEGRGGEHTVGLRALMDGDAEAAAKVGHCDGHQSRDWALSADTIQALTETL